VLAGSADFADGLEYFLQQGELVGHKGVTGHKFGRVFVATQADRVADKTELVVDDIALAGKGVTQRTWAASVLDSRRSLMTSSVLLLASDKRV
jgi:hypothetical protein